VKALLLAIVCVSFAAGSAWGQAGYIGIFPDKIGSDCALRDSPIGLNLYFIVHVNTAGAAACRFSAPKPQCSTAMWLSDTGQFPVTIGNSQTGVSVGYGVCRSSPIHVLTINFFTIGTTPPCCYYWTCPDPLADSGEIEVVDCNQNLLTTTGGAGIINSTVNCPCNWCASMACVEEIYRTSSNCFGVPVESATWGRVKDAYSE